MGIAMPSVTPRPLREKSLITTANIVFETLLYFDLTRNIRGNDGFPAIEFHSRDPMAFNLILQSQSHARTDIPKFDSTDEDYREDTIDIGLSEEEPG